MSQPPAKARILYLDHTSHLGGAERSLLDLLERLDRDRLEPILATSGGGPLVDRARALGIEVMVMSVGDKALELSREAWQDRPWRVLWQARGFAREIARLVRLVRARRIEAIHTNTLKAHVIGSIVAFLSRRPIIWHMRDLPSSRGDARRLLARFFALVRPGIVAISEAVAADMPPGMRARTRVVYNGIDLSRSDARAAEPPAGP
ncbi:MAG: glycosyltransferase, partial [Candidatus Sericytochromatia bacterium]